MSAKIQNGRFITTTKFNLSYFYFKITSLAAMLAKIQNDCTTKIQNNNKV